MPVVGRGRKTSYVDPRQRFKKGPSLTATEKQAEYLEAVLSGHYRYLAIGGGIRGTKTYAVLMALIMLCRIYPRSRWAIVRKDLPTLRRNTVPSMNKVKETTGDFVLDLNQSTWSYRCTNGSEILIFPESLNTDPDLDRWKGLEVNGFVLEEANELSEKGWNKSIERAGSWVIPGTDVQPPPLILLTFNPSQNWVKRTFFDPWKSGSLKPPFYFLPTTILDNPYASEEYRESLKNLPPNEYRRFVLGDWEATDDPDQLIKSEWIWAAQNVEPDDDPTVHMSVDVARFGDDMTTIGKRRGNALLWVREFDGLSVDRVASSSAGYAFEDPVLEDPWNLRVDGVGVGGGVKDLLDKSIGRVFDFVAGAKPVARKGQSIFRYKNRRSQAWWEFREKLRLGLISLPPEIPEKLFTDLIAVRYEIKSDKSIEVESKDGVKDRIGRSTDFGDNVVTLFFDTPPKPRRTPMVPSFSKVILRA